MTSELKPCPFCGAKAKFKGGRLSQESVTIWCENLHRSGGFTTKEAAAADWNTRAVPDVPELVTEAHLYFPKDQQGKRSVADIKKYDPAKPEFWVSDAAKQEYEIVPLISRPQAAEIIASKDARIKELHDAGHESFKTAIGWQQRAEAAEAKLAQYEAQEPAMWLCTHDDRGSDRAITTSLPSRKDILKANGYEITPLYTSPLAPEGGNEC